MGAQRFRQAAFLKIQPEDDCELVKINQTKVQIILRLPTHTPNRLNA